MAGADTGGGTTMKSYPPVGDIEIFCEAITRLREDDVKEVNNLNTKFISGRHRIDRTTAPASNSDVAPNVDRRGDYFYNSSYVYLLVLDGSDLKWARIIANVGW